LKGKGGREEGEGGGRVSKHVTVMLGRGEKKRKLTSVVCPTHKQTNKKTNKQIKKQVNKQANKFEQTNKPWGWLRDAAGSRSRRCVTNVLQVCHKCVTSVS
jgi:hypothetical protein